MLRVALFLRVFLCYYPLAVQTISCGDFVALLRHHFTGFKSLLFPLVDRDLNLGKLLEFINWMLLYEHICVRATENGVTRLHVGQVKLPGQGCRCSIVSWKPILAWNGSFSCATILNFNWSNFEACVASVFGASVCRSIRSIPWPVTFVYRCETDGFLDFAQGHNILTLIFVPKRTTALLLEDWVFIFWIWDDLLLVRPSSDAADVARLFLSIWCPSHKMSCRRCYQFSFPAKVQMNQTCWLGQFSFTDQLCRCSHLSQNGNHFLISLI